MADIGMENMQIPHQNLHEFRTESIPFKVMGICSLNGADFPDAENSMWNKSRVTYSVCFFARNPRQESGYVD